MKFKVLSLVTLLHNHGDSSWQQDTHRWALTVVSGPGNPAGTCSAVDGWHNWEAVLHHPAPGEPQTAVATCRAFGETRKWLSPLTVVPQNHEQVKQLL